MMLSICENFANVHNIRFSTDPDPKKSKSKAMLMTGTKGDTIPPPVNLNLCGQSWPWVSRCEHLGHTLTTDGKMEQDCVEKRAKFIDESVKVKESLQWENHLRHRCMSSQCVPMNPR